MLAVARLKVALLPTPSPSLPIHRYDPVKIGSLGPSNSRCPRPQRRAPLADFLQFREGMAKRGTCPGAVRYAYPFDYQHEATTLLPNSDFLALPDHVTLYGPVRAQTLGLYIPDSIKEWLLSGAPRIYDRKDLELPGNRQIALPSILTRYFCSELTIQQFECVIGTRRGNDE